ncbi:D-glycero-beta-D-manno-heptose 1-phosphate adenylyltransferase [Methylobacterium currus]|uniref:D-glycero-beta-D-manno-heptose 1-phosphate adenylyltransferase n=1 Tax=Methylobacterium currus TaxID=2051553 RepID=UPI001E3E8E5E|nr:D-glycero-beta-D-manno-heptose 1-phosphate adenylyltransferase [Methylobacterium currus]UHC19532.1 D-glycero-beta-D-manno-heptose 1-phosphate adenylyltransferase [Methylobacterium currus]
MSTESEGGIAGLLGRLAGRHVVVLGDAMLDHLVGGDVARLSPEAPVPVLALRRTVSALGGAANVARNAVSLGGRATLVSVVGDDAAGRTLAERAQREIGPDSALVIDPTRRTTEKTRFVAGAQHLLRVDAEDVHPVPETVATALLGRLDSALRRADALVLSDYAKGVLSPAVIRAACALARRRGVAIVADPKPATLALYAGIDVIAPNAAEAAAVTGLPVGSDAEVEAAARALERLTGGAVVLTRGAHGMTVLDRSGRATHLPTEAREVYDVSGAGDTVVAVLALAASDDLVLAARLANRAAGLAVARVGTTAVGAESLRQALAPTAAAGGRVMSLAEAAAAAAEWRGRGARVVLTNGCFDLLHPGHLHLITQARARGDRLIVAVNDDASVRRLKGPARPVQPEADRARLLAGLTGIDAVVLFPEDTPLAVIEAIRPDILVKGADYRLDAVIGGDLVRSRGGAVVLVPLLDGHSTTATLGRLADRTGAA